MMRTRSGCWLFVAAGHPMSQPIRDSTMSGELYRDWASPICFTNSHVIKPCWPSPLALRFIDRAFDTSRRTLAEV